MKDPIWDPSFYFFIFDMLDSFSRNSVLVISGILSLFKHIFKNENNIKKPNANNTCRDFVNNNSVEDNFEIDEEEKIVVALAASIMAGDGIPNPNLHIKRITRIS